MRRLALAAILALSSRGMAQRVDSSAAVARVEAGERADTAPVQKTYFTRRDLVVAGVAFTSSALVSIFDERIGRWARQPSVQGGSSRRDLAEAITVVNETPLTIGALLTYGAGRLFHSPTATDIGLHATEAMVLTVVASELIRAPLGRSRPRVSPDDPFSFHFGGGFTHFDQRAYPSIHSAAAFGTAAALVGEIRVRKPRANRWAAPILYTFAMVPGLTRIYLDEHWASDIVAGAFLGYLFGDRVVRYAHSHEPSRLDRWLLGTLVIPDGRGGVLIAGALPLR